MINFYNSNFKNLKFINSIFFLFPFLLISGPFLPDLFVTFFAIYFLIGIKKNKIFLKDKIFLFFIFFYIYLVFNSIISYNFLVSYFPSFTYVRMVLFAFLVSSLLISIKKLKFYFMFGLCFSYLILLLDSIYQLLVGHNILGFPLETRVSSFFADELIMGSFVARTLPIAIAVLYVFETQYKSTLLVILLAIAGFLILLSAERLAFAYYILILAVFIIIDLKKNFIKAMFILTTVLLTIFFLKPSSYDRLVNHTINQINNANFTGFSYRHNLHILSAYEMFKDNKVFGHGLKSFRELCGKEKFSLKEKIIKDHTYKSQINGKVFLSNKDSLQDRFLISSINLSPKEVDRLLFKHVTNHYKSLKLNDTTYYYNFYEENGISDLYLKDKQIVNVGYNLGYTYEFKNGCNTHPHNIFFQFISELGLIGIFFLIFGIIYLLHHLFLKIKDVYNQKNINLNTSRIFITFGLLLSIFPFFPSGNFFNNWLSITFYLSLSFHIFFKKENI